MELIEFIFVLIGLAMIPAIPIWAAWEVLAHPRRYRPNREED